MTPAELDALAKGPDFANCLTCDGRFKVDQYRFARGRSRYCSRPCARKGAHKAWVSKAKATDAEFVEELWRRVDRRRDNECWPWVHKTHVKGRGILVFKGRSMLAPRVAFFTKNGRWLTNGELACHSCDNPSCCNPDHIWAGTNRDNMKDASEKGRLYHDHCVHGHPFSGENLGVTRSGKRYCKHCNKAARKASHERRRSHLRAQEGSAGGEDV